VTSVEVQASDLCPRFTARAVRGVRIGPSPAWLAQRLQAIGQRPINSVADVTNYVMLELGQPLHAFDLDKLIEQRLVVRRARAGERVTTLDGVERELDPEMLVIADAARPVAVAGVMGGAETEISSATRNVLIEGAHFTPASIRRTSRALGLRTEASERFERGVDTDGQLRAQERTVALICELAGGAATDGTIDIYPQRLSPPVVRLRFSRVRELTGVNVEPRESLRILTALGFRPDGGGSNGHGAEENAPELGRLAGAASAGFICPSWRTDVQLEEDLVEEIARHAGYGKIEESLPPANVSGEYRAHEDRRRAARRALTAGGYDEAINFSFIDAAHDEQFELLPGLLEGSGGDELFVTLNNPIIEGATRMRATLLPGLLAAARHNFNHGTRDVRLFEAGRVFAAHATTESLPVERESLALLATGGALEAGTTAAAREIDFYDLKGALDAAGDAMNTGALDYAAETVRHLREGQAARVSLGGMPIGYVGQLSEEVAAAYKFRQPVYVAEVNLSALFEVAKTPVRYTPLLRFPSVIRDLTLVANRRAAFAGIRQAALDLNIEECRDVSLVYVYEGERVPEGQRSVTLRIEYRADDRTLRDDEVDELHNRIVATLEGLKEDRG
ncbi:MAG: phenylalanine--tRNA ligase subunit beta, partial [Acidobacteriota bacterium]|nr:phenylalanine--tRNA ligase subunit beta [Acidobacteriota bacterium]